MKFGGESVSRAFLEDDRLTQETDRENLTSWQTDSTSN